MLQLIFMKLYDHDSEVSSHFVYEVQENFHDENKRINLLALIHDYKK